MGSLFSHLMGVNKEKAEETLTFDLIKLFTCAGRSIGGGAGEGRGWAKSGGG